MVSYYTLMAYKESLLKISFHLSCNLTLHAIWYKNGLSTMSKELSQNAITFPVANYVMLFFRIHILKP